MELLRWIVVLVYVGASLAQPYDYWYQQAQLILENAKKLEKFNKNVARNLIMFLGDGMSLPTVTAGRILKGQEQGQSGEEGYLSWETFPHAGLSKTYNTDAQVPDSAGTATAFLCGVKTKSGVVGLDDNANYYDCASAAGNEVDSLLKMGKNAGKSVGIVTTARLTHATPSCAYAHTPARGWECDRDIPSGSEACKDIAVQFLENFPIEVALGGGRENFLHSGQSDPEYSTVPGDRTDGRDLTVEWVNARSAVGTAKYVWEKTGFDAVDPADVDYLLGLFEDSHMQYHRELDGAGEPTLAEMTQKAIQILQKNPNGFVLLVEAGRIDHGHHGTKARRALLDTLALDEAVTMAQSLTNDQETLTVVTADHSHTMAIQGYPARGAPILGKSGDTGTDSLPYTTLAYANGPGGEDTQDAYDLTGDRPDITFTDTEADGYRQKAIVPKSSETHGGDDVGIWATGPMAHLFHSTHEQSYIMHVMAYAACIDAGQPHCVPKKKTYESVAEIVRNLKIKK